MTKQLKGKIYWVLDDFAYIGALIPNEDTTAHIVARIENVIVADHMIQFYVSPHQSSDGKLWSYNVNLLINDVGTKFNGTFSEATEPTFTGEVFSELFNNSKKYLLYGQWVEDNSEFKSKYTFWAIMDKE